MLRISWPQICPILNCHESLVSEYLVTPNNSSENYKKSEKSLFLNFPSGLDPAMPLFITASKENKLDQSDAQFVDVIHTNALLQGKIERCGHADFYMNGGIVQPGCFQSMSSKILILF